MEDVVLHAAALEALPIFPLGQLVLFPHTVVPLHIFEPRYRNMIAHCMKTHRALAIGHVPDPTDVDENGNPKVSSVAGVGIIVAYEALADGRSNILLKGAARVTLEELPFVPPFRRARATVVPSESSFLDDGDRKALASVVSAFVREVRKQQADFDFALPEGSTTETWVDLSAHCLLFRSELKQALLEERSPAKRYQRIVLELALQTQSLQSGGANTDPN
jgi:Lon protease-like protein